MSMTQTKRCVKCGKKANMFCGYVLNGNEKLLAGWCSIVCLEEAGFSFANYIEWMGREKIK